MRWQDTEEDAGKQGGVWFQSGPSSDSCLSDQAASVTLNPLRL